MNNLFSDTLKRTDASYEAGDIEVLEGLEPVRKRPGMYVGGTDERALHHLVAEVLDNAMDEAVAGHASRIEVALLADGACRISDNGRGIPVDPHPKFAPKSALEVILTTLHSGGKFKTGAYRTAGGLHGVGISVVNALSEFLEIEVARGRRLYRQRFARGLPQGPLEDLGSVQNRRGTTVTFRPDPEIFGPRARLDPARIYRMARSKAYLFRGVTIEWRCDPAHLQSTKPNKDEAPLPAEATLHFPGGLADFLAEQLKGRALAGDEIFTGRRQADGEEGMIEWAIAWPLFGDGQVASYCNTVPTPEGGSHETGMRLALVRSLKSHAEMSDVKKAQQLTAEDVAGGMAAMLSVFIREPQFQGQTKEKLASPQAARLVEQTLRDAFDHWLADDPVRAEAVLGHTLDRMEERLRRRAEREIKRKTLTSRKKLRLPGKLTDCTLEDPEMTEIFIVEGDSAGGSAKQARDRRTQAILPIRGKILNVASASREKILANQEIRDIAMALGCGIGKDHDPARLRYGKVIIMTDADVDGAHIATLLMTFFFREMPAMVREGRLYLAQPPLYRLSRGREVAYARDDAHREELMETLFSGRGKVEVSRFKGLGEMPPKQLRETTMDPARRTLLRVALPEDPGDLRAVAALVERLMGRRAEERFAFIQENAELIDEEDLDL
ncbi:MAG: DNA topoisomerase IV subunit B [Alphaproteobacteria bacterium]|nr:MAG: DNA topoisomerase IV subunit B [Alphaproteobacteria bacterium]